MSWLYRHSEDSLHLRHYSVRLSFWVNDLNLFEFFNSVFLRIFLRKFYDSLLVADFWNDEFYIRNFKSKMKRNQNLFGTRIKFLTNLYNRFLQNIFIRFFQNFLDFRCKTLHN